MKEYEVEKRTRWECPEENDARILGGPNIVRPLMGPGHQPRTILGQNTWDRMRKRGYYKSGYHCEICGADCSTPGSQDFHELYTVDYEAGTATFVKGVAICKACHNAYHSGRLITLYKQGVTYYSKNYVLSVAEHCFKLIHEWNETHPDGPKLKAYSTWLDYLKVDALADKMMELIERYKIEFWEEDKKKYAPWASWRMIYGNKEYPTKYKDYQAWEKAMEKASENDYERKASNPFKGGAYDEIASLLAE